MRQKVSKKEIKKALIDLLVDYTCWEHIRTYNGLSDDRAKEIWATYLRLVNDEQR